MLTDLLVAVISHVAAAPSPEIGTEPALPISLTKGGLPNLNPSPLLVTVTADAAPPNVVKVAATPPPISKVSVPVSPLPGVTIVILSTP